MKGRYIITEHGVKENCKELQTAELQAVFDLCRENGGTVVIPSGRFYTGGLRMWSQTTLYLMAGAELYGSDDCNDYPVFDIPEDVDFRSDMELIPQQYEQYGQKPWDEYRRAIISVYGGKNIAIIGEKGSVIDGADCYDPNGEENYRGPHAILITCCDNVLLKGYTAQNSGNFLHEVNNCTNVEMRDVTCLAGSDGIHMHFCTDSLIENCDFLTGDDCIAGININRLAVRNCKLNTSCNFFRIGGTHILIKNCHMYGPGYYPHRLTIVKGKNDYLPREAGRHNTIAVVDYFASYTYPNPEPAHDIVFKDCLIENAEKMMRYDAENGMLQTGTYLKDITLDNVRFTGLLKPSSVAASPDKPLTVTLRNVEVSFRDGAEVPDNAGLFDGEDPYTKIITEA